VGSPDFSSGSTTSESLFVYNGTPYVAYVDYGNGGGTTVMKYVSNSWQPVGNPGFSGSLVQCESFSIYNGTPYVAYSDLKGATVMEYANGSWQPVGSPDFSSGEAWDESLYVYNGTPYVAYEDVANSDKATVMEYTDGSWQYVGDPGFSSGIAQNESLFVYNGIPYVAYDDGTQGYKITMMEYTNGSWQPVGNPGFSNGYVHNESLYIYNGIPYVAYEDDGDGFKATVMEYTNGSWQMVGNAPVSSGMAYGESLYVYNGTPYLAYEDCANGDKATVMEYNGSAWVNVGNPDFSAGGTGYESLSVYNGTAYVAYEDWANGDKATVMDAVPTVPALATTPTAGPGQANGTTAITATPNTQGDTLAVEVSTTSIPTPIVGEPAPTGTGVTNPYTSCSNISGVPAGEYVGVYELGSNGTVVAFTQIQLTSSDINLQAPVPLTWQPVGSPGFSSGVAGSESLYVYNGTPYVAYEDVANSGKATVMEYNVSSWVYVGSPDFSAGVAGSESLYVYNGTPYVAYEDVANGDKATVMEYTNGSWKPVGSPDFSSGEAQYESLYVYNGTPYVAYEDGTDGPATVMDYTNGSWQYVGSPGFSSGVAQYESLYVYNGTPYVVSQNSSGATVMEYTNGAWQPVGSPILPLSGMNGYTYGNYTESESLYVYNGTPYLAYQDDSEIGISDDPDYARDRVMEYTGGSWQPVGGALLSATNSSDQSLFVYNGTPYVVYEEGIYGDAATVMEYTNGSWQLVGNSTVSGVEADYISLCVYNGTPYVAYTDEANGDKATVMEAVAGGGGSLAAPTISPDGGSIYTSQAVSISATLSVDQAVYYTIDTGSTGTTPIVTSPVYSTPFIVSASPGTYTVDAAVYASVYGWGSAASATFTVSYPIISGGGGGGGGAAVSYLPTVQTAAATTVTASSAVLNGDITSDNGYDITAYGFLWGTSSSSLTNTLAVGTNNQSGAFTDTLSSLTAGTTYYFEAYATNSYGTADGAVLSFTAGVQPTTTPTTPLAPVFSDVSASYWGYDAISALSSKGIVSGYPDGTFKPDASITRAEFATMLVKALGLNTTGTTGQFTDVAEDDWFYGAVNAAASDGLISGTGDNLFAPNALITREQMAVMVAKALGAKAPVTVSTELNAFSDSSAVSGWAVSGMEKAVKAGIVSGISADYLTPQANATRAQAATMVFQLLTVLGK
jgi:hypothetical protein